jgi:hypothetical protein
MNQMPAVVGELVAKIVADMRTTAEYERNVADDCTTEYVADQLDAFADRLSALTAEAGKGEACAWIIENTTVGPGEPANIVDWHEKDIDKLPVGTKLTAALSTATPAGEWVLVPREPTEAMLNAAHNAWSALDEDEFPAEKIYRAMLAASPRGASAGESV